MLDWRSFSLLYSRMRNGSRNEEIMDICVYEDRDEPQLDQREIDILELRKEQEVLLMSVAQTLQTTTIRPYRALVGRLVASSQRPGA